MAILDILARAEVSSDLSHKEFDCAVDVLGAVGMSAIHNPEHLAIFRVKYLNDIADIPAAKRVFILWARRAMMRRGVNASGASRLGVQTLTAWLNDVCQTCKGLKFAITEGTPMLSTKACPKCKGTGKTIIESDSVTSLEIMFELIERADAAIYSAQGKIKTKLGERE